MKALLFSFSTILFTCSSGVFAQSFVNGNLEGTVDMFSPLEEPAGWVEVAYSESYCQASAAGNDSPDITNQTGPFTNYGISGWPHSGQTFVSGLLAKSGTDTTIWHEGIQQTVSGFEPFTKYKISFYQANVKQVSASTFHAVDESGAWAVYVDGNLVATTAPTVSTLTFDDNNLNWEYRELYFNALDTVHTIGFLPADDDGSIGGAIGEGLRMGIDLVQLESETTGFSEMTIPEVSVHPNPTNNYVSIQLKNEADVVVEVVNTHGQLLFSKDFQAGEERLIQLEGDSGLYFVKVRLNDEWKFYKIVKN